MYAWLTHGKAVSIEPQLPGHTDAFFNNTVVYGPSQFASWSIMRALLTLHTNPGSRYRCGKGD